MGEFDKVYLEYVEIAKAVNKGEMQEASRRLNELNNKKNLGNPSKVEKFEKRIYYKKK